MVFIEHLTEKPWLTEQGRALDLHKRSSFFLPTPQLGLRMFLGVVTVLFSLFVVAYSDRMTFGDDWRPLPEPWVMWVNTAILVFSSVAMHRAWVGADRGRIDDVRVGLLAGGGLAFAFVAGQLLAWQQLVALGYFAATNPANAFFYLITAVHAAHLMGGLVAWGCTTARAWRDFEVAKVRVSVELCAVYWHFLLVVWLVLFGLLLLT